MDVEVEVSVPLMRQFSKQIAGHAVEKGSSKPGMMKHVDGSLLKPILPPPRGPRELNFYKAVFDNDEENLDQIHTLLKPLLPAFRGVFKNEPEAREFLKLEDLTENFSVPCILDIKMGAKTYDLEASERKMQSEQQKYKETKAIGFCIPGMRVYDFQKRQYICLGKDYGKKLNKETVKDAFRLYLNSETGMNANVIRSFLVRLSKVRQWFTMQAKYAFFASSLLLIYDADSVLDSAKCATGDSGLKNCIYEPKSKVLHTSPDGLSGCDLSASVASDLKLKLIPKEQSAGGDVAAEPSQKYFSKRTGIEPNGCSNIEMCKKNRDLDFSASGFEVSNKNEPSILSLTEVRMIDFAHVFDSSEIDENYLLGLNSIISLLEGLLKEVN